MKGLVQKWRAKTLFLFTERRASLRLSKHKKYPSHKNSKWIFENEVNPVKFTIPDMYFCNQGHLPVLKQDSI